MNKPKPLPKKITGEIRRILEGCKSGKLAHLQDAYHCGTAHCIAGWKTVLDYAKERKDKSILDKEINGIDENLDDFMVQKLNTALEGDYARLAWRLSNEEARILFNENATFEEQFDLLSKLEKGERVI